MTIDDALSAPALLPCTGDQQQVAICDKLTILICEDQRWISGG